MAGLVVEEDVPRDQDGNLIYSGMLAASHKEEAYQLILDRRPQNAGERRLAWTKLPHGSILTLIKLNRKQTLRGSGRI